MTREDDRYTWDDVRGLLTSDDRRRIDRGWAPDLELDDLAGPTSPTTPSLLGSIRKKAAVKAAKARHDVVKAFADLLQAPELPERQREVLATIAYAIYRTVLATRDGESLKSLLPKIEKVTAAGLTESVRLSVEHPGAFASPEEVETLCAETSARTFTVLHTIHYLHLSLEALSALSTGGGSLVTLPLTVSAHLFLVGAVATVMSGLSEIYACASYISAQGHDNPAGATLNVVSSTAATLEAKVQAVAPVRDWAATPEDMARQIARQWLAKSAGTGVPFVGKRLQAQRRQAIVHALHRLGNSPASEPQPAR